MGLGLAISTGSLIVVGASVLAGIVWWMDNALNDSHLIGVASDHSIDQRFIRIEAALGIAMVLMSFVAFSIRSELLIF